MDLILIRHGQSQYNFDQTGGIDAPLTALGRRQAERAGAYLAAQFKISALYASTYTRARETAEIINRYLRLPPPFLVDDLREATQEYGAAMHLFDSPLAALDLRQPVRPADLSDYYRHFHERVARGLDSILERHVDLIDTDSQIAVVIHGGTCGTILRNLMGTHHFGVHTENTGMHILKWAEHRWHLVALNRVEHLLNVSDLVEGPDLSEEQHE